MKLAERDKVDNQKFRQLAAESTPPKKSKLLAQQVRIECTSTKIANIFNVRNQDVFKGRVGKTNTFFL